MECRSRKTKPCICRRTAFSSGATDFKLQSKIRRPIHDREGQATGAVIVFRDVSAARAMARAVGPFGRARFSDRLAQSDASERPDHPGDRTGPAALEKSRRAFLDLDGFKHINDSLGHPTGDKLLQSIAKRLVDCVRGSDTVSRQGGDEFVVLLSEVEQSEDAAISARRILQAVAEAHSIERARSSCHRKHRRERLSRRGLDAETLIKNADTAMYQAKENGRQSYQFFKPAMNVRAVERQSIEENLRRALERQEFALHYQPRSI